VQLEAGGRSVSGCIADSSSLSTIDSAANTNGTAEKNGGRFGVFGGALTYGTLIMKAL
jgi:hypothetical protein